jgi:biotin transport system substrate-specific component
MLMQRILTLTSTASARDILHVGVAVACMALAANVSMRIPKSPVPVTGQTVVVVAAAILLGPTKATISVVIYLLAGALGVPVFAGGASTTALAGPTAGYLLAFVPAAWLVGRASASAWTRSMIGTIGLALLAHAGILLAGSLTLGLFIGMTSAWTYGIAPFINGSVVKSALVGLLACSFRSQFTGDCSYGPR